MNNVTEKLIAAINSGALDADLADIDMALNKRKKLLASCLYPGQMVKLSGLKDHDGAIGRVVKVNKTRCLVKPVSGPWGIFMGSSGVNVPMSGLVPISAQ